MRYDRGPRFGPFTPVYDPAKKKGAVLVGSTPPGVLVVLDVTINQATGQGDPTTSTSVMFDVVFSQAVTGFTTGDVTLSGTATGTLVATVTNSGDDINFTVAVTGMTGGGTVIATIAAGVCVSTVGGAANLASTSTDNTVTWVDAFEWFGVSGGTVGSGPTWTGQNMVVQVACITRNASEELDGIASTQDGYDGGDSGYDGYGDTASGRLLLGTEWGSRSRISMRQDWLNFLAGDEYQLSTSSSDHVYSTAMYKLAYPWKVKQIASGSTAGTTVTATFASPVSSGSVVIAGIATLSGNSVVTGPAGFTADGTTFQATERTSRMTAFRSIGVDMTGETTRSADLSLAGGAMMLIEVAPDDVLVTALPTAIKATAGLLSYYPLQHTLAFQEKNDGGTLSDLTYPPALATQTNYQPGDDGRKYFRFVGGSPLSTPDNIEYTPHGNGGMTAGFLVYIDSLASARTLISKNTNAANFAKEWEVYVETDGSVIARTCNGSARPPVSARQRATAAGTMTTGQWYFVIVRFGNGIADFPTIRINGVAHTGTTSGALNANADSTAVPTVGGLYLNSSSRAMSGSMGHVFFVTTDLSDSDCGVIEAAAQADGWF